MAEQRISVQKLTRVRLSCIRCSYAIEIPLKSLRYTGPFLCPVCEHSSGERAFLRDPIHQEGGDCYERLAKAIGDLIDSKGRDVRIDFVIPGG